MTLLLISHYSIWFLEICVVSIGLLQSDIERRILDFCIKCILSQSWQQLCSSISSGTLSNLEDREGDVLVDEALLVVRVDLHQDRLRHVLVVVDLLLWENVNRCENKTVI